ncbi:MAG: hypothetical protein HGA85_07985 [Nanoarchaeota archaeon]|nr:hypothetical protein [Nanoarchaeota archaeon]
MWLIDLTLLLVLIFFVFMPALENYESSKLFYKRFSAKNIALLVDTVYTAPYPLKVFYDEKALPMTYVFEEGKVIVLAKGEGEKSLGAVSSDFIEDKNKEFIYKKIEPKVSLQEAGKETIIPLAFIANSRKVEPLPAVIGGSG